jgi:hypothetical protein
MLAALRVYWRTIGQVAAVKAYEIALTTAYTSIAARADCVANCLPETEASAQDW